MKFSFQWRIIYLPKDEIYRTVDEFIRFKLNEFPEWFIFRGETSDLDKYMIKK